MKYKLIKPIDENYSAIEQVLTNRGISYKDISAYLKTTDENIHSFNDFGKDVLWEAFVALAHCVTLNEKAMVIVDSDCDGYTSSALLINYLHDMFPAWVENKLEWFMHSGKQHGLSDFPMEQAEDIRLFLISYDTHNH